jgi:hypothetical protein
MGVVASPLALEIASVNTPPLKILAVCRHIRYVYNTFTVTDIL